MTGLSKTPKQSPPAWIAVYTTYNMPEAQIIAGRLKHEGIPVLINYPVGGSAIGITLLGETSVLVHPDHYQQALSILQIDEREQDALPDTTDKVTYHWDDEDDGEDYDEDYIEDSEDDIFDDNEE